MALTDVLRRLVGPRDFRYERQNNWGDQSVTRTLDVLLLGVRVKTSITTSMREEKASHPAPELAPRRVRVYAEPVLGGPVYDGDGNLWERNEEDCWYPPHFYDTPVPWWALEKTTALYVDAEDV